MGKTLRLQVGGAIQSDLRELVKDLRAVDKDLPKRLQQAHKEMATVVTGRAKSRIGSIPGAASGMTRKKAAAGVRPRAKQRSAAVALLGSNPFSQVFEFGARFHPVPPGRRGRPTVWVPASEMSRRVFPPWIGNRFDGGDWKDGLHGKAGHFVAPAIASFIEDGTFTETYAQFIERAFRKVAT